MSAVVDVIGGPLPTLSGLPYATRLRMRLAALRRSNPRRSFESAWSEAVRVDRPDAEWAPVLAWAKPHFQRAYLRQAGPGGVSLLTEAEAA